MPQPSICIESLEARKLMSFSAANHVFSIAGAGSQPNTITVGLTDDGTQVTAQISYPYKKTIKTVSISYPLSRNFKYVKITGGKKSDLITIDQTNGSFPLPTRIHTGSGNDTVVGGDEADSVVCGNGYDSVTGGEGNDILIAGNNVSDTLVDGNGADTLIAGKKGHDVMIAGNGPVTFVDGYRGHNTMQGGSGADHFVLYKQQLSAESVTSYTPAKDKLVDYPRKKVSTGDIVGDVFNDVLDYL